MSTKNKTMTSKNASITDMNGANGIAFRIDFAKSYDEMPEERAARIAAGNRARRFESKKHKSKGGRQGAKRSALRDY